MSTFHISYTCDGKGLAIVEAENEEEARGKFFDGDCEYINEPEENFEIRIITKK